MSIKKLDQVYTKDNRHLGKAHRLYHRTTEIRPKWEHYATYVHVESFELGDDFYVPTDFVAGRDPQTGYIILTVTGKKVENKTWTRLPDFILRGEARKEELAEREEYEAPPRYLPQLAELKTP
ncbi:MAG: hypothetical protein L0332_34205 [Chloroflexi bacterium]|nr:hypothetical protein [Chloroflexota bacterium]MCI0581205.1 hypothetical protein [Chloroflexota bacterium]MCI0644129.1 hypothetical protein [Chloroflexota bacterium]MCI0731750.1 hypothetical protein [Chloroflexota bacterium]